MSGAPNAKIIIDNMGGIHSESVAMVDFAQGAGKALMELYDVGLVPWAELAPICDKACEVADQIVQARTALRYMIRDVAKKHAAEVGKK